MRDLAIRARGLGKKYKIGATRPYKTLRESLSSVLSAPVRLLRGSSDSPPDEKTFWAVKDVSFDIAAGETVGVIGRNGAGKSTLLKILSRITEPTEGRADVHGKISALLEVGTGFHPELSGRENIFLNGAILGMKRAEVLRRFDEIVAFAEVERFVDTAVKHYSSGMYLRLAFSVAAHLEPDILVVDEVLAVGDASFQRKCLAKMEDVGQRGRAVVFVSHNMQAVTRLCSRAILLDAGRVVEDGPSAKVAGSYLRGASGSPAERRWEAGAPAPGNGIARLVSVRVVDETGSTSDVLKVTRKIGIEMVYDVLRPGHVLVPNFHFFNEDGVCVFVAGDTEEDRRGRPRAAGRYATTIWIPGNLLNEGAIFAGAALSTTDPVVVHFWEKDAVAFQVVDAPGEVSVRVNFAGHIPGAVRPLLPFETREVPVDDDDLVDRRAAQ